MGKCGITSPKDAIITNADPALFLKGFFDNLGDDAEAFLLEGLRRAAYCFIKTNWQRLAEIISHLISAFLQVRV
jgi:hypothetical protein